MDREEAREKENREEDPKERKDFSSIGKANKFLIYFGMVLLFIGILVLFTSMMFLEFNFYNETGVTTIYIGLLMIPTGLFLSALGFTAIALSSKDIDHRLRLGALIATGICILCAFVLLFVLNFLFLIR